MTVGKGETVGTAEGKRTSRTLLEVRLEHTSSPGAAELVAVDVVEAGGVGTGVGEAAQPHDKIARI